MRYGKAVLIFGASVILFSLVTVLWAQQKPGAQPSGQNPFQQHLQKGKQLFDKRQYDQAIAALSEAIKLNPKIPQPYIMRGLAQAQKRRPNYAKAIEDFGQAIKLDPKNGTAYYNRGIVYVQSKNLTRALSDFNEALKLKPKKAEIY